MKHFIKARIDILLFLSTMATASCTVVGTLNPIYDNEKSFVVKEELLGKWTDPEDKKGYILIEKAKEPKQYRISMNDIKDEKEETIHLLGHLVNDNGTYFLEYWYDLDDDVKAFTVAKHFIVKIFFINKDKIECSFPDGERLIKLIDEKKLQLSYIEKSEGKGEKDMSFLIINKTPALQHALKDMKKYPELFKDKVTLTRSE